MIFRGILGKLRGKRGNPIFLRWKAWAKATFVMFVGITQAFLGVSIMPSVAFAAYSTDEQWLATVNPNQFGNPSANNNYVVPVTDGYFTLITRLQVYNEFTSMPIYYSAIDGSTGTWNAPWVYGLNKDFQNPPLWAVSTNYTNALGSTYFQVYGRQVHYTIDQPIVDLNTKQVTISVRFPKIPGVTYLDWLNGTLKNTSANVEYGFWRNYGLETDTEAVYTAVDPAPRTEVTNQYMVDFWFKGNVSNHSHGYTSVFVPSDAYLAKVAAQAAQQAAEQVNSIVNPALTISGGVIQDNQGTVLQAARQARDAAQQANNKLDSINNAVTNISQSIPPVMNGIHGLNGATATSSGALQVVIDSSGATQYSYRIDNGGWSGWMPIADTVSIPVPKGVHTLTIQVANGPVGTPGPAAKSSMQVIGL